MFLSSKSDVFKQKSFNINAIFVIRSQYVTEPISTILYGPYEISKGFGAYNIERIIVFGRGD